MPHRIPTHKPFRFKSNIPTYRPFPFFSSVRHREYDAVYRNKESKHFYNSSAWKNARVMQLHEYPLCDECQREGLITPATHVHHRIELSVAPELALDASNHQRLCQACHSRLHELKDVDVIGGDA